MRLRNRTELMFALFAVWIARRLPLISASAKPCWRESAHRRFVWAGGEFMTGLTSTAGWITISREGGP